ncbi:histidine kinase [Saccharothrix sp. MB29]|nr:histidine kinase [Saccharothrix sp. MB29]
MLETVLPSVGGRWRSWRCCAQVPAPDRAAGRRGRRFFLPSTLGSAVTERASAHPVVTEVVAAALLVAAGCRRLPRCGRRCCGRRRRGRGARAVVRHARRPGGAAAVAAALTWAGPGARPDLRDADARHRRELERTRADDRLRLPASCTTGGAPRDRHRGADPAAQALAGNPAAPAQDPLEVYGEIEEAAAEALTATRRLVGVLRSDDPSPAPGGALGDVLRTAAGDRASAHVADDVEGLPLPPSVAGALHRVVLEALTNVRRHAPRAADVRVAARAEDGDLVVEVANDGVPAGPRGDGYGLTGMAERVAALGGALEAGPRPGGRWLVTARVPLGPADDPFDRLPRGI